MGIIFLKFFRLVANTLRLPIGFLVALIFGGIIIPELLSGYPEWEKLVGAGISYILIWFYFGKFFWARPPLPAFWEM